MYPNLKAEMARFNISLKNLSRETNIAYDNLVSKMSRKNNRDFKRKDMYAIHDFFLKKDEGVEMRYLFMTHNELETRKK